VRATVDGELETAHGARSGFTDHKSHDVVIEAQLYRPLTPGQLAELHTQHHEIAAHTVTHPILTNVDNEHLHAELVNSRAQLENWIGAPVTGFCYPNGSFDERVEQAVKDVGYMYACTTSSGMNRASQSHMQLSRLAITMQRTVQIDGSADIRGFRAELSRLREWLR
jgi:peptidoglycan/xylan/chitin deacetylase (PgdA/CDA1 family)